VVVFTGYPGGVGLGYIEVGVMVAASVGTVVGVDRTTSGLGRGQQVSNSRLRDDRHITDIIYIGNPA
jgi:hypothetical protein